MKYKHVFFDLDRTLWDFETNSAEMLTELIGRYKLREKGLSSTEAFLGVYRKINHDLWDDYRRGLIDKATLRHERFKRALQQFGLYEQQLCDNFNNDYVRESPLKTTLFPHAKECLTYLTGKYKVHIITNGFEETQHIKIRHAELGHYFTEVITSERAGYKKPDKRIFDYSLSAAGADPGNSLMIGDHFELDINGARNAGIDQCFFNPSGEVVSGTSTYEIRSLGELIDIL